MLQRYNVANFIHRENDKTRGKLGWQVMLENFNWSFLLIQSSDYRLKLADVWVYVCCLGPMLKSEYTCIG